MKDYGLSNNYIWIPLGFDANTFDPFSKKLLTKEGLEAKKPLKPKLKGFFEIYKDFHKNHSMKIVLIALSNYFIKGIPIEKTILECDEILHFTKVVKKQSNHKLEYRTTSKGQVTTLEMGKVTRYIVSNKGGTLIKIMPPVEKETEIDKHKRTVNKNQLSIFDFIEDVELNNKDRETNVEAGYFVEVLNKLQSKSAKDYSINYDYYFNECYKIINAIENKDVNNDIDLNTYYSLF